ncbi:unnamed protein product [Linum trigynum]|uniref:fructose-bisphosphate aldolase n=1 Tax=Linum trigynum TaxID=586398 RepID=A0AAV2FWH3_9ROSI
MEAWERVWGRLDEDRTNGEVSRKPHEQTRASHGRASEQSGRVIFAEATHGQPMKSTRPCHPGRSTLKAWAGKEENWKKAHDALLTRCKANSEAVLGKYKGDATPAEGASESLHVKDYKY